MEETRMRKAMVVRAGSALGSALIERLEARGMEVIAISKPDLKSPQAFLDAAAGVDTIFYGTHLRYDDKPEKVRRLTEIVMEAANRIGAKVVRIEGIYQPVAEPGAHSDTPPSVLRIQSPELYGASVKNTIMHYMLKKLAQGKKVTTFGSLVAPREYLYLPDAANRIVELASWETAYGQTWNIRSGASISLGQLLQVAGAAIGILPKMEPIGGWKLRLLHRYDSRIRDLLNRYELATQIPHKDQLALMGTVPITTYEVGVVETISRMITR
jgi:nucleoside-diphosphate-sugar epimerase